MDPNSNKPGNDWSLPQPAPTAQQPNLPLNNAADSQGAPPQPSESAPYMSSPTQQPATFPVATSETDSKDFDKEIAQQVKTIARQYASDPYTQVVELNKLRATYLQQRFGKKLEVSEP